VKYCPRCAAPLASRTDEGRERQVCEREGCGFIHYGNPLPVVAAIVETPEGVVLVRNPGWPDKWFGLVTGFLERGETPEQGILREIKEEIGLSAEVVSLIGAYAFTQRNELIVAYHVRASGEIVLGPEIEAFKRVPVEKLRAWPFGTGEAVRDWLARRAAAAP
jgi:NADH pyrophosphatase NudC (nudix superfamily)